MLWCFVTKPKTLSALASQCNHLTSTLVRKWCCTIRFMSFSYQCITSIEYIYLGAKVRTALWYPSDKSLQHFVAGTDASRLMSRMWERTTGCWELCFSVLSRKSLKMGILHLRHLNTIICELGQSSNRSTGNNLDSRLLDMWFVLSNPSDSLPWRQPW